MSEEDHTPEEFGYPQQEPGYPPPAQEVAAPAATTTNMTVEMLRQTKPWVRFLSIMGFIGAGLMILCGLIMGIAGVAGGASEMFLLFIFYPLLGLLYIFPALFLHRYANGKYKPCLISLTHSVSSCKHATRRVLKNREHLPNF